MQFGLSFFIDTNLKSELFDGICRMIYMLKVSRVGVVVLSTAFIEGITLINTPFYRGWCVFELRYLLHRHLIASKHKGEGSLVFYNVDKNITVDALYKICTSIPPIAPDELGFRNEDDKELFENWMKTLGEGMESFMSTPYEVCSITRCQIFSWENYTENPSLQLQSFLECVKSGTINYIKSNHLHLYLNIFSLFQNRQKKKAKTYSYRI
jgi:hypothetical protein